MSDCNERVCVCVCVYCEARTDTGVCNERRATRMTKERKPEKREIGLDPRDRPVFAAAASRTCCQSLAVSPGNSDPP